MYRDAKEELKRLEVALLEEDDRVTVRPRRVMYDQRSGYIRHIFDCEAI